MRPVSLALQILQGDTDVSYGYLLPTLISTKNKLTKLLSEDLTYCKPLVTVLATSLQTRFSNYFNVDEDGEAAAVAAAVHPKFKLRWLPCLDTSAQKNVRNAITNAIISCRSPSENIQSKEEPLIDGFDFDVGGQTQATIQCNLEISADETDFRRFCNDTKTDLSLLHAYPAVKAIYLKFNTLLPSSASVERLFSFAGMFDIAKFNRLTDANFEKRVLSKANRVMEIVEYTNDD
ncbi:uncharacterized protein LOC107044049 [Diachasma alloeum]|nr:uncharacterized protein LOC107044049 [Diachasma alloeum]